VSSKTAVTSIQNEIRQNRPFSSKHEEAAISLMRTADLIRRLVGSVVDPHDITVQQYNVLRILRGAGEQGLPTLEIAERMIEQTPGITRLIDRLEEKKLVNRERCHEDRRRVWCRITTAGLDLLARLDEPVRESIGALSTLGARDLAQLVDHLDRAREGVRAALTANQQSDK
jgi:DNA-binding MarR family transcriptional regulator